MHHSGWRCFTNPVRDSSRESSVKTEGPEQNEHSDLQDPAQAILQQGT